MDTFAGILPQESAVQLPRFQTKAGDNHISLHRIVYLKACINYTLFQLETGEQVMTTLSLSKYSILLEKHGFMRLHKSYLLNLRYLHQCRIHHFLSLTLPTGQILQIARRKRAELRKMVKKEKYVIWGQ